MTTFSVLIGSYGLSKWEDLVRVRALPSVHGQGFHEIIVKHEPDATLAEVRNACASEATGDYLIFLDADDELSPGFLNSIKATKYTYPEGDYLLTPSVQYVRGGRRWPPKFWPEQDIHDGNWMIIGTAVPRNLFLKVGGFREYAWSEDWALWSMCMKHGAVPIKVPDAIYIAHVNHKSRNRVRARTEVLYWHSKIGSDIWPQIYEKPTEEEDAIGRLHTNYVRRVT